MPVFAYTLNPENPAEVEKIQLVGETDEHVTAMRAFLAREAVQNAHLEMADLPDSDIPQIAEKLASDLHDIESADPNNMPSGGLIEDLIAGQEDGEAVVVDAETGLQIARDNNARGEDRGLFNETIEEGIIAGYLKDLEGDPDLAQIMSKEPTHMAFDIEPIPYRSYDYAENYSFGHMDAEGNYVPFATILRGDHPFRQAIAAARAASAEAA